MRRSECTGEPHDDFAWNHARADQYPPTDSDWFAWAITSGRGAGKTRTGSELTHQMAEHVSRIALVAATAPDVRDIMLEGESGLLSIAKPGWRPDYEPSKRRLTWPNGCVATTYTAEKPDQLRGPEHAFAWIDEPAKFDLIDDVWDNLSLGLRIGQRPRVLVTTTPKPIPWLKKLLKDETTRHTVTSTYANLGNLAPTFARTVLDRYEGTRLGRQELHGELLEDVEGALWTYDLIHVIENSPPLQRIVVGIDPAGGNRRANDETGIIVAGADEDGHIYILHDATGHYTPRGWAMRVDALVREYSADLIVAERNFGGQMVEETMRANGLDYRIATVHARFGKAVRAEPLVGYYEQGKAHHVGQWPDLVAEMTEWVPYEKGSSSPNRVDALVYASAPLLKRYREAQIASPVSLQREVPRGAS